ncbi:MAG: hypothetical protein ACI9H9_002545 [Pseudoalteromonas tetraodonis]|jgi:hypothetical protein|uniref:MxaD family protein n=5 Tax=Pseudoalteromonas TaxID=53246 RepID=A0AA37S0J2_9GAMM|nr:MULTISPECIES: SRPBCC family protein [Pseudoalteromonas]ALQ53765.1 hypothetical protein PI2015_0437 [Pseudoalteromonas issachenkonii]ATC89523.1 hypothetical protein PISS_a0484 [Pseudoalteromonas issachenkonii]ATD02016.1 hypothetical protein PTET_a0452 [Pseudoalteromonas tetraodonis]KYL32673.1 hypothetical protein A2I96_17540 [Pseudoalteromonas spiralis]MDN3394949.1 SRPBCC family protein [Pseudoalteromonas sp. APC 3215]
MLKAQAQTVIIAPSNDVWELIGGFNSLPDWLPFIRESKLSEGGRVRTLQSHKGDKIIERLEGFSEDKTFYSYSIINAPFPVSSYLSTISVKAIDDKSCQVTWFGSFMADDSVKDSDVIELFTTIYSDGLKELSNNFV